MSRIEKLCNEYRENRRLMEELQAMQDSLKADIIAEMHGADVVTAGNSKASYTSVESVRFDSKAFQARYPELFQAFSKNTSYKRFNVI